MSYNCYSCFTQLNLLISSEDDQSSITCNNCGIINYINNNDFVTKHINVNLIVNKLKIVLDEPIFETISSDLKNVIILHAPKIGTYVRTSLYCFCLLYIEYKNQINFLTEYSIKKKQRKHIIKLIIDIEKPSIMKFIRTPLTYIELYSNDYSDSEKEMFINTTYCLMYIGLCNKKKIQTVSQKINQVLLLLRNNQDIIISGSCNLLDIIKYIMLNKLTVKNLLYAENKLIESNIYTI
jgi:hypothetical protein